MENIAVSKVTVSRDKAKITLRRVPDAVGVAAGIFSPLADAGIVIDIIVQNLRADGTTDISFALAAADHERALAILRPHTAHLCTACIASQQSVAKVSVLGVGMRSHASVAARMFQFLTDAGVNILLISTSEIKISCLIADRDAEAAARALRQGFGL